MHHWYVVQVFTSHEKKVKKALDEFCEASGMSDLIDEVLVPTEKVMDVIKGEQKIVERRIWPGYVLIKMELSDDSWQYVKKTTGVIDFLGGENPTSLTDQEVAQLLSDLEEKKSAVTQKHRFDVGDTVKINDGVFVNFIGTVVDIFPEKGRLSVQVAIFGRETRVDDLEFVQVEEVSDQDLGA